MLAARPLTSIITGDRPLRIVSRRSVTRSSCRSRAGGPAGPPSQALLGGGERRAGAGGGSDGDEPAVQRHQGRGIQDAGAGAIAVHGLDRRFELEATQGLAER